MKSHLKVCSTDLAGYPYQNPHYLQTRKRINYLVDRYLSVEILSDRLFDTIDQFENPCPRRWELIDWHGIVPSQIVGVQPELFCRIIAGAAEIEAPISAYAKESWEYLQHFHPQMARFLGGTFDDNGAVLELGVWQKEERQHSPTFKKIYNVLTGEKLFTIPNSVQGYCSTGDLRQDVYNHMISRISTEWGAIAVYLWLMAHSTGTLQQAIAQPLQDEVNHLTKFWGFCRWAFSESYFHQLKGSTNNLISLLKHHQYERTHGKDILSSANISRAVELSFIFTRVMVRLRRWNWELSPSTLLHLYGNPPKFS